LKQIAAHMSLLFYTVGAILVLDHWPENLSAADQVQLTVMR